MHTWFSIESEVEIRQQERRKAAEDDARAALARGQPFRPRWLWSLTRSASGLHRKPLFETREPSLTPPVRRLMARLARSMARRSPRLASSPKGGRT